MGKLHVEIWGCGVVVPPCQCLGSLDSTVGAYSNVDLVVKHLEASRVLLSKI